jgi:hypothetical protein
MNFFVTPVLQGETKAVKIRDSPTNRFSPPEENRK